MYLYYTSVDPLQWKYNASIKSGWAYIVGPAFVFCLYLNSFVGPSVI